MRKVLFLFSLLFLIQTFGKVEPLDSARWAYVESIVLYDVDTRYHIFKVSTATEVLSKIHKIQQKTQKEFQSTIKALDQEEQEVIYSLLSQEGLLLELLQLSEKELTGEGVQQILDKPEYNVDLNSGEVYQLFKKHPRTMQKIKKLGEDAQASFSLLIEPLDGEVQQAYEALVRQPEVLSILIEQKGYTEELGKAFEENPDWIIAKTDSLAIYYQGEQEKELAEYKKELEENPELKEETLQAAKEYAEENGEDPEDIERAVAQSSSKVTVNVTYSSYPYWYGYPYYYPAPVWRPYPWYYHCGFYVGPGGGFVVFGMPSYRYTSWYYRGPCYRYPASTRYHAYHHHRYPYSRNGFNNSYRRNNIIVKNNQINIGGKKTNINMGNRYDLSRPAAQQRPNRPSQARDRSRNPNARPSNQQQKIQRQETSSNRKQKPVQQKPATRPSQSTKPKARQNAQPRTQAQQYRANDYHNSQWSGRGAGAGRQAPQRSGGGGRRGR